MNKKRIIAFSNQKGGVGKTTSVVSVADFLSQKYKVLLIDLDPQGNATTGLGVDKAGVAKESIDLLTTADDLDQVAMSTPQKNLDLVPTTQRLVEYLQSAKDANSLAALSKKLVNQTKYDYVLIDCPPSLDALTYSALVAAGSVIVPLQAEYYALEGLSQLIDAISNIRSGINPELDILGILITMYDSRTTLSRQVVDQAEKYFPDKVFDVKVPRNVRLAEAPSHGQTIREYDRWSKGSRAYKQLTKEIIERTS